MPKIDIDRAPAAKGSGYPAPFNEPCLERHNIKLGDAAGLTQFGVSLTTLKPGVWSSQRHWHGKEDEFVYVLSGEVVLVEEEGETILKKGECAGWKAGVQNGHCVINRGDQDALLLTVGSRDNDDFGEYPDIDMKFGPGRYTRPRGAPGGFMKKDGTLY